MLGFCSTMVLPLDAMGRNATECQGASKSPCPGLILAMEACQSAVPYLRYRVLPPGWATAPPSALCPLPSPGRCPSHRPGAHCVPTARRETLNRPAATGAGARERLAAGREPHDGLCRVALSRDAGRRPGATVRGGGERGPPPPSLLPRGRGEEAGTQLAPCRWVGFSGSGSHGSLGWRGKEPSQAPRLNPCVGTLWGHGIAGEAETQPVPTACVPGKQTLP